MKAPECEWEKKVKCYLFLVCFSDGVRKSIIFRSDFPANEFTQESATEKYVSIFRLGYDQNAHERECTVETNTNTPK